MKILNSINSVKTQTLPTEEPTSKYLSSVEVKVCDTTLYTLVDTSASNMFMSSEVAKSLGLHIEPTKNQYKAVNTNNVMAIYVAQDMEQQIDGWKGELSFKVISLDYNDLILVWNSSIA